MGRGASLARVGSSLACREACSRRVLLPSECLGLGFTCLSVSECVIMGASDTERDLRGGRCWAEKSVYGAWA
jgi:hypothetical protein